MRAAVAVLSLCCCVGAPTASQQAAPTALRCEYLAQPVGVDAPAPRFSWVVGDPARGAVQSAFQVLVASRPELLAPGAADAWDSGKVAGDRCVHVEWAAAAPASGVRYYWTVRCWDGADRASRFAEPQWFETGLLRAADWGGSWIGDGRTAPARDEDFYGPIPAPRFRKAFRLAAEVRRARLYVAGLGYFVASLNGTRVGDHRLDPAWTRFDRLVPYAVHDVTAMLRRGDNALGVELGNGWYNPLPLRLWGKLDLRSRLPIGQPKLRCRLAIELADGSTQVIVSDPSWRTAPGPILRNNVYLGEWQDGRLEQPGWDTPRFADDGWTPAVAVEPPGGELRWLPIPPIRATRELRPVRIRTMKPGMHVVDFGQNFAGVVRLDLRGSAGDEIVLRYAEELRDDGSIDVDSTVAAQVKSPGLGGPGAPDVAWQEDRYVCRGGTERFEPRFTWHGFRYVEIAGMPEPPSPDEVTGIRWNTDLARVSAFSCSNPLLNRIQEVVEWTLLSNAFGILSDCPARERFGYGGDMVASGDAYLANFDMAGLHAKAVGDFSRDTRPDGGLPECAPDVGVNEHGLTGDTGPIGWMFAHPFLLHRAWEHYGDRRLVEEQYETLTRFVGFCRERIAGNVTVACFGDHGGIGLNPPGVHATATWHRIVSIAAELAEALGREDDAAGFRALAGEIAAAFAEWISPETGVVLVPTQTSQATALHHGLVPPDLRGKAFAVLLDEIAKNGGRLSTGMFGTGFLLQCLGDAGRDDLAYELVATREYPGYGFMIDQGATTLWEHWSRERHWSRNHPMYSAVSAWFQRSLLGIRQAPGSVAWQEIVVAPAVVGDLQWARGHFDSVRGRVGSAWARQGDGLVLDVEIPANARATVFVPMLGRNSRDVFESGTRIAGGGVATGAEPWVEVRRVTDAACEVGVGGGRYRFEVR